MHQDTTWYGVSGLANRHLFPEFRELLSGNAAIPCDDLHQSFTCFLIYIISGNIIIFVAFIPMLCMGQNILNAEERLCAVSELVSCKPDRY